MANKKAEKGRFIAVYADWLPGYEPFRLGTLWSHVARGDETFAFEYDQKALARPELAAYQ